MDQSLEARIGRYLSGEMTSSEKASLEQEAAGSPALQQLLSEYTLIWSTTPEPAGVHEWDIDSAMHKFSSRVERRSPGRRIQFSSRLWWVAAATVLVLIGSFVFFTRASHTERFAFNPESASEPILLADGSRVLLNEGAVLSVHRFTRKARKVTLTGEAFFEVSPDSKRPFSVMAGGTVTEVVGTSFNIRQVEGKTSIIVNTGKVLFASVEDKNKIVALTAGEAADFVNQRIFRVPNPSPNVQSWRTRQLIFKNMPLSEIVTDVESFFGVRVRLDNPDIRNCRITMARPFIQPEIQPLLQSIALTVNATVLREGDVFVIRGGSCS